MVDCLDLDMRLGLLSRYTDSPINGHPLPQQGNLSDIHRNNQPQGTGTYNDKFALNFILAISSSFFFFQIPSSCTIRAHHIYFHISVSFFSLIVTFINFFIEPPASLSNQFTWHPSGDMHMSVPGQGSVSIDTRNHNKDNEDVEVMSTDSSSSSSSDSQ